MPDELAGNVLREAGEAIGNVGRRLLRRRRRFDVQQALARWEARVPLPSIPPKDASAPPEGEVVEGTCRIIDETEEEVAGHER